MFSDIVQTWFQPIASGFGMVGLGLAMWIRGEMDRRIRAAADALELEQAKIRVAQEDHDKRLTKLEAHWESLPTRDDFHKIALQMAGMAGDMKAVAERLTSIDREMKPLRQQIDRVNDYLLEERK